MQWSSSSGKEIGYSELEVCDKRTYRYFWGYSLAFSSSATNGYIGNLEHFGLINVLDDQSPGSPLIPELLYSFFQMEFACVTVGILMGGIAERGRVLPAMVLSFVWTTLVYCPIAFWVWAPGGCALAFRYPGAYQTNYYSIGGRSTGVSLISQVSSLSVLMFISLMETP
jgi:ammonia channel protein AmtB